MGWVKSDWTSILSVSVVKALNSSIVDLFCTQYTCSCHTQQLAISDAFKSFKDDNESMLDKCQKLTAHLKRADNSRKLLHAECALAGHKPNAIPVANDTRWDSGYDCMKGVFYHQPCLLKLAQAGQLRFEDLNGVTTDLWPPLCDIEGRRHWGQRHWAHDFEGRRLWGQTTLRADDFEGKYL